MDIKEEKILTQELGKIGGPKFVVKLLPNDTSVLTLEIEAPSEEVLKKAFAILKQEGRIIENKNTSRYPTISAVVGSGFGNLNPALVQIEVIPLSVKQTRVSIKGTAKEGLIKQHGGEKSAEKIRNLLSQSFSTP